MDCGKQGSSIGLKLALGRGVVVPDRVLYRWQKQGRTQAEERQCSSESEVEKLARFLASNLGFLDIQGDFHNLFWKFLIRFIQLMLPGYKQTCLRLGFRFLLAFGSRMRGWFIFLRRLDLLKQGFDFFPQLSRHLLLLFRALDLPVKQQFSIRVVCGEMFLRAGENDKNTRLIALYNGLNRRAIFRDRDGGIIPNVHHGRQGRHRGRDGRDVPFRAAGLGGLTQGFLNCLASRLHLELDFGIHHFFVHAREGHGGIVIFNPPMIAGGSQGCEFSEFPNP